VGPSHAPSSITAAQAAITSRFMFRLAANSYFSC
jgi:hypothetical protein